MRKKFMKRTKAMIMTLVMAASILVMGQQVKAEDLTTKIVVSGIEADCDVYAYAIALDAVDANGNHYWKYNSAGTVESLVTDGEISGSDIGYFYRNLNTGSGWNAHDGGGVAVVDATVISFTENADGTYSASGVKPGLYVIAANKETHQYSYSGNVVAVNYQYNSNGVASIADKDGVINVTVKKTSDPVIKKEVVEDNETQKHGDASVGDVVDFQITITMPQFKGNWQSDQLHYIITDSLSEGLTLDVNSIKVGATDIETLFNTNKQCANTSYTVNTSGFTLDLYGKDVWQYSEATIQITYQATLNEKANVNFENDENKVSIKYSTTPSSTDMSDPITDNTYHYTFGINTEVAGTGSATTTEITKYGIKTTTEMNNKVALDGAQFQLFDANGKKLYFTSAGQYTTDTTANDYIETKNSGKLTITGLDAGTYTLKESKAPRGYALDKTTYTITITPTYNDLTGELSYYTVNVNGGGNAITFTHDKLDDGTISSTDNATDVDTFGINNTPLLTLPETGGVGIVLITALAIVMMAGFGCVFMMLKKNK